MRKLIILRGAPGVGKSTFVNNFGLDEYSLSLDKFRQTLFSPTMNRYSHPVINNNRVNEEYTSYMFEKTFDFRMKMGETIVVDNTNYLLSDVNNIIEKAREYYYDVLIVDFFNIAIDIAIKQDQQRPINKIVGEKTIKRMYDKYSPYVGDVMNIEYNEHTDHIVFDFLNEEIKNLSHYDEIIHIGDIQGCYDVLVDENSPIKNGVENNKFYIFVGDFLDRGLQNDKVLNFIIDKFLPHVTNNVVFVKGNHESHLEKYLKDGSGYSDEFNDNTIDQIENIDKNKIQVLVNSLVDVFVYTKDEKKIIVTHGGLPCFPKHDLWKYASSIFIKGFGNYSDSVDMTFDSDETDNYQVHGHRNTKMFTTNQFNNSFNLEGQVEHGGTMRFAILSNDWKTIDIRNTVCKDAIQMMKERKDDKFMKYPDSPWIARGEYSRPLSDDEYNDFQNHSGVRFKTMEKMNHIHSINFTKNVFFDASWDSITNKSRGLFIDDDKNIVARSYEKFFNLNEREETNLETIKSWNYPIYGYLKENGFLGIIGYDKVSDDLIFCSKSTNEGPFAEKFKEMFLAKYDKTTYEKIYRYVKFQEASIVIEVNMPDFDPHIIEYDSDHIVILDIVRRDPVFEKIPYDDLKKVSKYFDIPCKEQIHVIKNERHLDYVLENLSKNDKEIEGIVLESSGKYVKVKSNFYNVWKYARSLIRRYVSSVTKGKLFDETKVPEELSDFFEWAIITYTVEELSTLSIIEIRNNWLNYVEGN